MHTLAPDEAAAFERHLPGCPACSELVERLQRAAEDIPPITDPPTAVRSRLMETVRAEASLFAAAQAGDARAAERRTPGRLVLGTVAAALLGVGALAGAALDADAPLPQAESYQGSVTAAGGGPRSKAAVVMREGVAQLVLTDLAAPPEGRVYQAWVVKRPSVPTPTGTLFSVPRTGDTVVSLPDLEGVERVIVSAEPPRGSRRPTPPPVAEVLLGG